MLVKTDAVVLKQNKFGEGNTIITLFSKKMGKLQAIAQGSKSPRGKYAVGTQPFFYGEYILFKGRELYQISQVDMKESFYGLRENVMKLSYAAYLLELTEAIIIEGQTNNRLFDTLVSALHILSTMETDYETITKAYELKLLMYSGYKPELTLCVNCGVDRNDTMKFSSKEGGILCSKCFCCDIYGMNISTVTVNVMEHLMNTDLLQISKLKIKPNVLIELNKIMKHYIHTHINKNKFKSLDFLDAMKEFK